MCPGELDCVLLLAGRVTYAGSCRPRPFSRGQAQSSHGPRKALWDPASITSLSPPVLLLFPFLAPSSHADHFPFSDTQATLPPLHWLRPPRMVLTPGTHMAHCPVSFMSDSVTLSITCRLRAPSDRLLPPLPPASLSPLACATFILFITLFTF